MVESYGHLAEQGRSRGIRSTTALCGGLLRGRCGDPVSLDHLLDAEASAGASWLPSASPQAGSRNMTALAATCTQVADAAQNILICAVGVSPTRLGEVAHIGSARVLPGQPPSLTVTDACGLGLGCRGTTRGTSADRISVQCVLSVRPRVASAQVERPARPSSPLLIRGFRVRAPGAPPAKTSLVDLVFVGRVSRPTDTACLALRAGHSITQSDCQPEPPEPALPNRRWWEWVPWAVPQECRLLVLGAADSATAASRMWTGTASDAR